MHEETDDVGFEVVLMNSPGTGPWEQQPSEDHLSDVPAASSPAALSPPSAPQRPQPASQPSSHAPGRHQVTGPVSKFQKLIRNSSNCGGLSSPKQTVFQWLIYLSLSIFLFIPAEMSMSHSSCWRIFFFNALLCVYLQPADLQDLGAVGRGLMISAATAKAVKSH